MDTAFLVNIVNKFSPSPVQVPFKCLKNVSIFSTPLMSFRLNMPRSVKRSPYDLSSEQCVISVGLLWILFAFVNILFKLVDHTEHSPYEVFITVQSLAVLGIWCFCTYGPKWHWFFICRTVQTHIPLVSWWILSNIYILLSSLTS